MKKIDNIEYYNVGEIVEKLQKQISIEKLKIHFEEGKIKGEFLDFEWYSDNEEIENYANLYLNEKYYTVGPLEIDLNKTKIPGRILDIGGGGEAVIGQFKGNNVIAIDPSRRELEEAPKNDALNIIMDAKDLKFLDNTFDSVTMFFTMMYIPTSDHKIIFQEIHRILKENGDLFLWDLTIPERSESEKEIYVITLKVSINDKIIETGYGTKWEREQNVTNFITLGEEIGFKVSEQKIGENIFFVRFKKN
jgi:ubiquinone/menaquinone biosynthesis C-methylase UbiE